MKDVTSGNFGVVIAFWLPGFLFLWGLSFSLPEVHAWLENSAARESVSGFLYATMASLAVGMLVSAVRWMIVDHFLICVTGLKRPKLDFSKLKDKDAFAAFQGVVENHYRYYQYYANTFVAVGAAFGFHLVSGRERPSVLISGAVLGVCVSLILAARNALKLYFERSKDLAT